MKYSSVILIIQRYTRGHFGRQLARARRAVVRRDRACLLLQRLQRGRVARVATALLVSVLMRLHVGVVHVGLGSFLGLVLIEESCFLMFCC